MQALLKIWLPLFQLMFFPSFFGLYQGPNPGEKRAQKAVEGIAGFDTALGESSLSKGLSFDSAILSGDMGKIAQLVAPETRVINQQLGQQNKSVAEFGNRSGGNNASMVASGDKARGAVAEMISSLMGNAKGELVSAGSGLVNSGTNAYGSSFDMSKVIHDQDLAKFNDLIQSIAAVAAGAAGGAAGGAGMAGALQGAAGGAMQSAGVQAPPGWGH